MRCLYRRRHPTFPTYENECRIAVQCFFRSEKKFLFVAAKVQLDVPTEGPMAPESICGGHEPVRSLTHQQQSWTAYRSLAPGYSEGATPIFCVDFNRAVLFQRSFHRHFDGTVL